MDTSMFVREREREREREIESIKNILITCARVQEREGETTEEREHAEERKCTDVCVRERKSINI